MSRKKIEIRWDDLHPAKQIEIREEFGNELATDLEETNEVIAFREVQTW